MVGAVQMLFMLRRKFPVFRDEPFFGGRLARERCGDGAVLRPTRVAHMVDDSTATGALAIIKFTIR